MNWAVPDKFVESEANICYYEATIQKALEDNNTAQQAEAFLFQQVALPNGVGLTREAYADLSVAEKDRYLAPFVDFMKTEVAFAASALKAYAAAVGNPYLEGHFVGVLFRKVDWEGFASEMQFRLQIHWFKISGWWNLGLTAKYQDFATRALEHIAMIFEKNAREFPGKSPGKPGNLFPLFKFMCFSRFVTFQEQ